ncbi:MAG: hypothetical protein ACD_7C00046G0001 [uncultured bacterium]|nr:MAG: hypothetical protein ACD_7C00046G0001 [uncultured bacterium]
MVLGVFKLKKLISQMMELKVPFPSMVSAVGWKFMMRTVTTEETPTQPLSNFLAG